MKQRKLALLLACAMTGSLFSGCGGEVPGEAASAQEPSSQSQAASAQAQSPAGDSAEGATINLLWHGGLNQTTVIREMLENEFKEQHPEITLVFTEVPSTDIANKAMMEVTGKTGAYDIAMQYLTVPALVNAGGVEPLDAYIERDSFPVEKMIDVGFRYKDHVYGLPIRADCRVVHYNEEYFTQAGLDPEKPPKSMEEFTQYAKALTRDGHYGVTRRPLSADNFTGLLFEFGGQVHDESGEPAFNSPEGLQAIHYMIEQYADGTTDPLSTSWQHSDEISAYLSGGGAMYNAWPARFIDAKMPEKSKIVGKSRAASVPGKYALCGGWIMLMFNTCKNKDAAWEVMKFIEDPANQKEVILRGGDCNPTHLDVLFDEELQKDYEVLKAIGEEFDRTRSYPVSTQTSTLVTLLETYLPMAVMDGMDPQQALDQCAAEYRQALVDAGEL